MRRKNKYRNINSGKFFKSILEEYCFIQATKANLKIEYEPITYVLIPPKEYKGIIYEEFGRAPNRSFRKIKKPKVSKVTYTPDFIGYSPFLKKSFIIETKGVKTQSFIIKWKLFKQYLLTNFLYEDRPMLFLPRNKKQVDQTIQILTGHENNF